MKKLYIFNNYYTTYRKGKGWQQVEVQAETIIEAKRMVREMGHQDLQFERIKILEP